MPSITIVNPTALKIFKIIPVSYRLYASLDPNRTVTIIPNIQIKTVLQTSAIVRDTGLITFEIVTPMGTASEIENK